MMWGYPYFGPMMATIAIWSVIWLAIVGALIWALVRWVGGRASAPRGPASGPSALEILRERYARGELDADTFDAMQGRIRGASTPGER